MIGFRERKHNWASRANLLFIDNPVGTGFSYVEPHANFCEPHIRLLPACLPARAVHQKGCHECGCWAPVQLSA